MRRPQSRMTSMRRTPLVSVVSPATTPLQDEQVPDSSFCNRTQNGSTWNVSGSSDGAMPLTPLDPAEFWFCTSP